MQGNTCIELYILIYHQSMWVRYVPHTCATHGYKNNILVTPATNQKISLSIAPPLLLCVPSLPPSSTTWSDHWWALLSPPSKPLQPAATCQLLSSWLPAILLAHIIDFICAASVFVHLAVKYTIYLSTYIGPIYFEWLDMGKWTCHSDIGLYHTISIFGWYSLKCGSQSMFFSLYCYSRVMSHKYWIVLSATSEAVLLR